MKMSSTWKLFLASLLFFALYFLFIGDLNAPRQGTEGFYLKIASEMWNAGSWITPLYQGEPHWSKPPLHFWLAFPFYALTPFDLLTASRVAILVLSLWGLIQLSLWTERHFAYSRVDFFLFAASTVGVLKYSRIFMMEMPLVIFSTLTSLALYDYYRYREIKSAGLACLYGAASVLVKGPVSLAMIGPSFVLFLAYEFRKNKQTIPWGGLVLTALGILALSSVWFLVCLFQYGMDFIDYFFIRENLGKFTSKAYPVRVVFQGLVIFSLPWSLYLVGLIKKNSLTSLKERFSCLTREEVFVWIHFLFFLGLWLIPNQRSHHYAIPSLFFFLILLYGALAPRFAKGESFRWINRSFGALAIALALLLLFVYSRISTGEGHEILAIALSVVTLLTLGGLWSRQSTPLWSRAIALGFVWSALFCFTIPQFALPILPDNIVQLVDERSIAVAGQKPFYVEQALNRPVQAVLVASHLEGQLDQVEDLVLLSGSLYRKEEELGGQGVVLKEWRVWKRGLKLKEILEVLKTRDSSKLYDTMILWQLSRSGAE